MSTIGLAITVRAVAIEDYEQWLALYTKYIFFCRRKSIDQAAITTLWQWIMDNKIICRVAIHDNKLIGLTHVQALYSPLNGRLTASLEDLFVEETCRHQGVGEQLLDDLKQLGKAKEWLFIRWKTREDNHKAQAFYDKIAKKTAWQLYQLNIE